MGNFLGESNPSLIDFTGLESLQSIGGALYIDSNDTLQDLVGLANLHLVGSLSINQNKSLKSLIGIDNLDSIAEDLSINATTSLKDLTGLEKISFIGNRIWIRYNDSLLSLNGLNNVKPDSIYVIEIDGNPLLSECEAKTICDYLAVPDAWLIVHDNLPGCNSKEEVEEACTVSVSEISNGENLKVYPNPFTTSTTIEYELNQPSEVTISIYNYFGELVKMIRQNQSAGKQQVVWDAEGLPAGVYYYRLSACQQSSGGKLILLHE